jgi:hypothetical protein
MRLKYIMNSLLTMKPDVQDVLLIFKCYELRGGVVWCVEILKITTILLYVAITHICIDVIEYECNTNANMV